MSTGPKKGYNLETIVHKATSSKIVPPKRKHVRNIILQTHNEHGAAGFYHEIFKRPLERDDVTTYKALVTIHSVLHEGHPKVMEDSYYRVTFLESLRNNWRSRGTESAELICLYIEFLLSKIMFHHNYPEFQGDFSIEAFLRKKPVFPVEKSLQIVGHMQDLQQSINTLERKIFAGSRGMSECKASALIPLVLESFGLYQMTVHLIKGLVNEVDTMDVLQVLIERFYAQFMTLKTFYSDTANIKYVTSIIAVPTLPKDPPEFKETKTSTPRLRKREPRSPPPARKPIEQPVFDEPKPQPQQNPNWNPFANAATQQQTWVTFEQPQQPVFTQPQPVQPVQQPVYHAPTVQPQPVFQQAPIQTPFSPTPAPVQNAPKATQGGFGDILSMVNSMKRPEEEKRKMEEEKKRKEDQLKYEEDLKRRNEEVRIKAEKEREEKRKREDMEREEKRRKEEMERKRKDEEARAAARDAENKKREQERLAQEQERIKKIVQEETSDELRKLKLRILELETELEREKDKNKDLSRELEELRKRLQDSEKETEALITTRQQAQMSQAMVTSLNADNQRLQAETESLKAQMAQYRQHVDEENDRLLVRELENARDSVELGLSRLDNPTNMGNEAATSREVNEDAQNLIAAGDRLLHACTIGAREDLYESVSTIVKQSALFFDDVKGASRKVFDDDARQKLLDSARAAGDAIANLLSVANNIGGKITDEESRKETTDSTNEMRDRLKEVQRDAINAEKVVEVQEEEGGEDLEALAEKELLAAAKVIEKAAETLLAAQTQRPAVATGVPDVAGAILDAAMAITKATAMLVTAAAAAQKERVEKGKVFSGALYKRDPTWSQGLISSAKAVAAATQTLIMSANDAVQGKVEDEQVVAASKGVASATAHLIAATRAKSDDPNGPTQQKLSMASKAIATAVAQLVAAAKLAAKPNPDEMVLDTTTSETARKIKEMEMQTQILKLEKELENARNGLGNLRNQWYKTK